VDRKKHQHTWQGRQGEKEMLKQLIINYSDGIAEKKSQ